MRWRSLLMAGALLMGPARAAEPLKVIELPLPRAAVGQEALRLKLTAGSLPRGALLRVTTEDGRPIGTVSPFGTVPAGQDYELALPKGAANGATVRLQIQIQTPNSSPRAPTADEILGLSLVYVPVTE